MDSRFKVKEKAMGFVIKDKQDGIGIISLNRPEKRNALSPELVTELASSFQDFQRDVEVAVIVLRSEGKAFCAGADLAYLNVIRTNGYDQNLKDSQHLGSLFKIIHSTSKPIVAAIQGHAIAGGCGLAMSADLLVSVPEAKFGFTEVKIGFVPALIAKPVILKAGHNLATEMLLTANLYSAEEMHARGVINKIVERESLEDEVLNLAGKMVRENASGSMQMTKKLLDQVSGLTFDEAISMAAEVNAKSRETEDFRRGLDSFLKKD